MRAMREIAGFVRREDGGIIVFFALLLPVILLFLSLAVDIGNWWVHRRHLQLQADAAALAGGALFGGCFTDSAAGNTAIQNEATRFGGGAGSTYNGQVGGANQGRSRFCTRARPTRPGRSLRTTLRRRPRVTRRA